MSTRRGKHPSCFPRLLSHTLSNADANGIVPTVKDMSTLREIFLTELSAAYCAETQIIKALPKFAEMASDPDLKEALETHLSETDDQIKRLEGLFGDLHLTPKKKKCKAIEAILEEGRELATEEAGDAAVLCAAQKIEHFEMACYQTLVAWARALDEDKAVGVLEDIFEEEELTNEKLTEIADTSVIPDALRADEAEVDEEEEHETT